MKIFLIISASVVSQICWAQNSSTNSQKAVRLLQRSYSKCIAIKNGYYEMNMKMKFMDAKDTSWNINYKFFFNKLKNDSVYFIAFNSERFGNGHYIDNTLYTGDALVAYSKTTRTASIKEKNKWLNEMIVARHNDIISFYSPFTNKKCDPLPQAADYTDGKHHFNLLGEEITNHMNCYHIREIEFPKYDSSEILHNLKETTDFWINKADMIPVKYSIQSTFLQYGDTLSAYEERTLSIYHLNNVRNLRELQLSAIPSYCKITNYTGAKKLPLLTINSSAPGWRLFSLNGKKVSLSDYKGKLVLIDFFYRNCYSCMKSFPVLDSLREKYKNNGLVVIGIDPIDSLNEATRHFVKVAGIRYPVLSDRNQGVAKEYKVSGYPTTYLVDKNGMIIFGGDGYDQSMRSKLDDIIRRNL